MKTIRSTRGNRFLGLAVSRLALVTLLGAAAEAIAAQPQDGAWTGTTGQGRVYNFTVRNAGRTINPLTIGYALGSCTGTFTFTSDIPIVGITSHSFSVTGGTCPRTTTSGSFSTNSAASGTVTFSATFNPPACSCSGSVTVPWSATRAGGSAQANLAVTKTDGRTTIVAGSTNTYTITVTNLGPTLLNSLTLTDHPPSILLNPVFTPSAGAYNSGTGAWTGLNLAAGQSVSLNLSATVSPSASGTLSNTATVSPPAGVVDPVPSNNSSTDTTTVIAQANLAVTKTDGRTTVVAGRPNSYTITVTNLGPAFLSSLTLTDQPPSTLLNPVFTPSSGAYNPGTGAWTGLGLSSGQSATLTLAATVSPSASGTLANTASVSPPAGVTDPDSGNNSSTDSDTVVTEAHLAIIKTGPGVATAPTRVTYRLTVTNNGPSNAAGVTVVDTTPAGLTFVSNTGACSGPFPCNLGTVPAGQNRTIDTTFAVPDGYAGPNPVSNMASVSSSTPDPLGSDDSSTATTQVVPPGPASNYFTVAPCRLLDTRDPSGPYGGPALVAGQDRRVVAVGDRCLIPITAKAISVNVTVTASTNPGNLRLYPGGQTLPLVSTLNYSTGQTRGNNAIVSLSALGEFIIRCTQAAGTAHAIVDVNGYFE